MQYLLPDKIYNLMKWVGLIFLPALATLYSVLAPMWGWPHPLEVVGSINAAAVFIGALIGVSQATAGNINDSEVPND